MDLKEAIETNRARQQRARSLNTRAGEDVFHVFSREEAEGWLTNRLEGARCAREIADVESLLFPPLSEEEVARVLARCPDTIPILESEIAVEYADSYGSRRATPRVSLSEELCQKWQELSDEGYRLPDGRSVEIAGRFTYSTFSNVSIPALKRQVLANLNARQWELWQNRPPEIEVPDPSVESSAVPFVVVAYGHCVVTELELKAFGTVSWDSWYNRFSPKWCRDFEEAQGACRASDRKLDELKAETRERASREEARAAAEASREELRGVQSREGWRDLDYELRRKVEERTGYYARLPETLEDLRAHKAETEALCAEVEAALAGILRRREEEARAAEETLRVERASMAGILRVTGEDVREARDVKSAAEELANAFGRERVISVVRGELHASYGRGGRQAELERTFHGLDGMQYAYRLLQFSRARDLDSWLAGILAALGASESEETRAPSGSTPKAPAGEPSQDSLQALLGRFGRR